MELAEERIQPMIKETTGTKMMINNPDAGGGGGVGSRRNSITKSLSQISIISSLLNETDKNLTASIGNEMPAHLYSTPKNPPMTHHAEKKEMISESKVETVTPEPLQMNDSIPKDVSKVSNLMQDQEKNLQMPPPKGPSSRSSLNMLPIKSLRRKLSIIIWLGVIQLLMSIVLVALGGLIIARNASLAGCGAGIWAGGIAGITGSFGVMGNIKKAHTAFLATSLICVASSTLALALTGIGAVRDSNYAQQDETKWSAVSAGSGLIVCLLVHFIVSIVSVYNSALKLCSSPDIQPMQILENSDHSTLTKHKVEEYIHSIAGDQNLKGMLYHNLLQRNAIMNQNEKANSTLKGGSERLGSQHRGSTMKRPILLVPAGTPMPQPMLYQPPQQMVYHPNLLPPGYIPTTPEPLPPFLHPQDLEYLYRTRSMRSMPASLEYDVQGEEERKQRKREKRQRREMEKAFTYTGLDRAIAESFLEQQERVNHSQYGDSRTADSFSSDEEQLHHRSMGHPEQKYGDIAM